MKILVIGSGGREHALVWKISQSKKVDRIYCAPGNPGTELLALADNIPIKSDDIKSLFNFAKKEKIDLTVVGPEAPVIDGVTDLFEKNNLSIIGPSQKASQIEGSKVFAKKLMLKYGIPTAKFVAFDDYHYAKLYLRSQKYPLVIKADGQCLGKGVKVCENEKTAQNFLKILMVDKIFGQAGSKVIIEECLTGQEVSFMVATDGKDFVTMLPSQDHKAIYDKDKGPNTGGMGAYTPVPFVDKKIINRIEKEIIAPTISAMKKESCDYKGILYPGLILTSDGPKVLEFNCRFGDPETQSLMALLQSDIIDLFEAIVGNRIKDFQLKWNKGSAVCVVLASKGYPGDYEKGQKIKGLELVSKIKDVYIFHSGTKMVDSQIVTSGGRVLGITARGNNLRETIRKVYKYIGNQAVCFPGMQYRKDIGKKGMNKKLWQ